MIWEILIAAVTGFVTHQSIAVTARMPDGWRNLTEHAIGVAAAYPLYLLFRRRFTNGNGANASYWLAFVFVGMGVALGWLLDTLHGGQE